MSWGGDAEIRASEDAYTAVDPYDLSHSGHDGVGQPKVGDSLPTHIWKSHQQVEDSEPCLGPLVLGVNKLAGVVGQSQQVEGGTPDLRDIVGKAVSHGDNPDEWTQLVEDDQSSNVENDQQKVQDGTIGNQSQQVVDRQSSLRSSEGDFKAASDCVRPKLVRKRWRLLVPPDQRRHQQHNADKLQRAQVRARRRKDCFLLLAPETLAPHLLTLPDSIRIRYEPRSHPTQGWLKCVHKVQARTPNVSKGFKLGIPANGACTDCEFQEALLRSFEEARCWSLEQVYPVTEAAV